MRTLTRPNILSTKTLLPGALSVALLAPGALAGDLIVGPGDSIQNAIMLAVPGDRVVILPGTYKQAIDFQGKAIEVMGLEGAQLTAIDASGLGLPTVRMHAGEGPGSVLRGLTLRGGDGGYGASSGVKGGGVSGVNLGLSPLVAAPTLLDCVITDNRATWGGGVAADAMMMRCSIYDNHTKYGDGGGAWGAVRMFDCLVAQNTASDGYGGGIAVSGGPAEIQRTVIRDNASLYSARGGGVHVASGASAQLLECLLVGNRCESPMANAHGAGISVAGPGSGIDRCTIEGNRSEQLFGMAAAGIHGPVSVRNSIVRNNTNPVGGFTQVSPGTLVSHTNIQGGHPGPNMDAPAGFVDPPNGDYHLVPGSPCIDMGDPFLLDPDGSVVDMGAFTFSTLYTRSNTQSGDLADPGFEVISAGMGGHQSMVIQAGAAQAGDLFLVLGSVSGTSPGFTVGGMSVPLVLDLYTLLTLNVAASPVSGGFGVLDGAGSAVADFEVATGLGALAGLTVHHAALAFDPAGAGPTFVSNALAAYLAP